MAYCSHLCDVGLEAGSNFIDLKDNCSWNKGWCYDTSHTSIFDPTRKNFWVKLSTLEICLFWSIHGKCCPRHEDWSGISNSREACTLHGRLALHSPRFTTLIWKSRSYPSLVCFLDCKRCDNYCILSSQTIWIDTFEVLELPTLMESKGNQMCRMWICIRWISMLLLAKWMMGE